MHLDNFSHNRYSKTTMQKHHVCYRRKNKKRSMFIAVKNVGSRGETTSPSIYCLWLLIWPQIVIQFFCESHFSSGFVVYNNNDILLKRLLTHKWERKYMQIPYYRDRNKTNIQGIFIFLWFYYNSSNRIGALNLLCQDFFYSWWCNVFRTYGFCYENKNKIKVEIKWNILTIWVFILTGTTNWG